MSEQRRSRRRAVGCVIGMGATAALAAWSKPSNLLAQAREGFALGQLAPAQIGAWRMDRAAAVIVPAPDQQAALQRLYQQTLARAYVNTRGERVMLSLAYGADQSDGMSVHLPEICYSGQGFKVDRVHDVRAAVAGQTVPIRRLMAVRGWRNEPVSYWVTTCGEATVSPWRRRLLGLREGLKRRIPDALLVRASSLDADPPRGWRLQEGFLDEMARALPVVDRLLLLGQGSPP